MPHEEINFDHLKSLKVPKSSEIIDFFEKKYINGHSTPPEFWSVYDRVVTSLPRTTNQVEVWHRRMQAILGKDHLGLNTIISELKKNIKALYSKSSMLKWVKNIRENQNM